MGEYLQKLIDAHKERRRRLMTLPPKLTKLMEPTFKPPAKPQPKPQPKPLPSQPEPLPKTAAPEITTIKIREIQNFVCNHFGLTINDLLSHKRPQNLVFPRHIAMYLAKNLTLLSYPNIGRLFGGRDHSAVMHAVKKIQTEMDMNENLKFEIEKIKNKLLPRQQ